MQELNAIQLLVVWAPPILLAITLHEIAHGWTALRLGDNTARAQGRLSLNPLRHVDPVGTILVPALLYMLGGVILGWARPVPVNFRQLRQPRRDMALVAAAGPAANLLMALGWAVMMGLAVLTWAAGWQWLGMPLLLMANVGVLVNVVLAILNLLPVPPLDGSRILASLLPPRGALALARLEPYGLLILLLLLVSGVLGMILGPVAGWSQRFLHDTVFAIFGMS